MEYLLFLSFKCDGLQDQQGSTTPSGELEKFSFFLFPFLGAGVVWGGRSGDAALRLPVLSRHAGS